MAIRRSVVIRLSLAGLVVSGVGALALGATEPAAFPSRFDEGGVAASQQRGRVTFGNFCGSCHGRQAEGDGPVAEFLEPKPSDLTRIAERYDGSFPAETIHQIIDGRELRPVHGSPDMPVWGNAFQVVDEEADEEEISRRIDDLVAYLKSIQVDG